MPFPGNTQNDFLTKQVIYKRFEAFSIGHWKRFWWKSTNLKKMKQSSLLTFYYLCLTGIQKGERLHKKCLNIHGWMQSQTMNIPWTRLNSKRWCLKTNWMMTTKAQKKWLNYVTQRMIFTLLILKKYLMTAMMILSFTTWLNSMVE